jgi:hypothetical protein
MLEEDFFLRVMDLMHLVLEEKVKSTLFFLDAHYDGTQNKNFITNTNSFCRNGDIYCCYCVGVFEFNKREKTKNFSTFLLP